ncbi:hypothetical protein BCR42DRAFT_78031 [Absidia repens]|uniref:Uncharacterized protein n=1 Tax=Absidia repens TaxID=90262 RepID=A0A1X2IAT8_9FUNG|nr:hypothetical protein BCR42DRAFT_78031 [Absidia repens]
MYHVEFSQSTTSQRQEAPEIMMNLTQLQVPEDILRVQAIEKRGNIIIYQVITRDGNFSTCQVDLGSSPTVINRTTDTLKKAISDTLADLSEMESSQIEMDAYHEDINRQLVVLNKTLYTLQTAALKKKRQNSVDFSLNIVPFIKYASITSQPQACLQIRIHTKLDLNWTDWHLNIDISSQRTTKQESDTYALNESDYSIGKTFLLPLVGFEHDHDDDTGNVQTWERDLELDQVQCPFPLDIYVSLSMNMNTNMAIEKDSSMPEYLPASNNASNSCTSFLVTFMVVDHLHFAKPLSNSRKKQLKQNGLKDVTAQLLQSWKCSTDIPGMNSTDLKHNILNYETSNIRLRFVAPANADDLFRNILSTLLSEGKSSDEVERLIDDAEHAYLSLGSHPLFPATITLSKVSVKPNQDLHVNIQLCSLSALVLAKIETSLLSRLQPYAMDDDGDNTGANLNMQDSSAYYQTHRLLENQLVSLEKCYQQEDTDNDDEIWQKFKTTWDTIRQLQNDTWLCIHDFSI